MEISRVVHSFSTASGENSLCVLSDRLVNRPHHWWWKVPSRKLESVTQNKGISEENVSGVGERR